MEVRSFKMPFRSKKFNLNQKVFVVYSTGAEAALCYGQFRGRGRWISAWVNWCSKDRPTPAWIKYDVDDNCHIAKRLGAFYA